MAETAKRSETAGPGPAGTETGLAEMHPHLDPRAVAAAEAYFAAVAALTDRSYAALKMFTVANLFLWHLDAFTRDEEPVPLFVEIFHRATKLLDLARRSPVAERHFPPSTGPKTSDDAVGELFGTVYSAYPDEAYFADSERDFRARLEANNVDPEALFRNKVVLDAGCGGGKFTHVMAKLGARKVIGMDISESAIDYARAQARKLSYGERLEYRCGSVLDLPQPDSSVDIVWSNSVVHLVDDHARAIAELARVLKPGGMLYIYVDGRFGLFELLLRTLHAASRDIPPALFRQYLVSLGVDPGRISWMLPCFYAPYKSIPRDEVVSLLAANGLADLRQLTRGIEIDQIEQVSAGLPYAEIKYGEAQLKFFATKKPAE